MANFIYIAVGMGWATSNLSYARKHKWRLLSTSSRVGDTPAISFGSTGEGGPDVMSLPHCSVCAHAVEKTEFLLNTVPVRGISICVSYIKMT